MEYYTARSQNVQVQGGNLVITAIKENYSGPDGVSRNYTSARLETKGLFSQQYGRFEASIKIPKGQGMWPAFWMLGSDIDTNPWPTSGEIDITENIGKEPAIVHGWFDGPGYAPGKVTASYTLPSGALGEGFICMRSSGTRNQSAFMGTAPSMRRSRPQFAEWVAVGVPQALLRFAECSGGRWLAGAS